MDIQIQKLETLLEVLMRRDGLSRKDAQDCIDIAKLQVLDGEDPAEILEDDFGLEPDYIHDLLPDYIFDSL